MGGCTNAKLRHRNAGLLLTGALCAAGALALAFRLAPGIVEGVRTMSWSATEGILLSARHVSGNWPGQGWKRIHRERLDLWYAYQVGDGAGPVQHYEGWAFDAKPGAEVRSWADTSPISPAMAKTTLREAPRITVYYDPQRPDRAVVQRGIPFDAAVLLVVLAGVLGTAIQAFRLTRRGPNVQPPVAGLLLFLAGGGLIAFGGAHLTAWTFGVFLPWWLLAGYGVTGFLAMLSPDWERNRFLSPLVRFYGLCAIISLCGLIGIKAWASEPSPEYVVRMTELPSRLAHSHPAVRMHALRLLEEEPAGMRQAISGLTDPDPGVRGVAISIVQQLARSGWSTELGAEALGLRLQDPDPVLARRAAWALVNIHAHQPRIVLRDALPGILRLLEGDAEAQVAGIRVLELAAEEALPLVPRLAAFLASSDRQARGAAAHVLGTLGPGASAALPALEAARDRAEDDRERGWFEAAIRRMAGKP